MGSWKVLLTGHYRKAYGAPALTVPLAAALTPKPEEGKQNFLRKKVLNLLSFADSHTSCSGLSPPTPNG